MITLNLTDVLPFGKYKGWPIDFILTGKTNNQDLLLLNKKDSDDNSMLYAPQDWKYLLWFHNNVDKFKLSTEVQHLILKVEQKCINEAWQAERAWNQRQYEIEMNDNTTKKIRSQRSYSSNSMNEDYMEHGMSLQNMGYEGDGT